MKKTHRQLPRRLLAFLATLVLVASSLLACFALPVAANTPDTDTHVTISEENGDTYSIFTSGQTASSPQSYGRDNYAPETVTNGGYDLYCTYNATIRLGRSFTVGSEIAVKVALSVLAYDTDEESGESDGMFLVDETDGTRYRFGKLSGWNETWNTTTLEIPPEAFTLGHTYHFEMTEEVDGWHVWVRDVTLIVDGFNATSELAADLDGSIDISGLVEGTLFAEGVDETYDIEFKVVDEDGNQRGYLLKQMTVSEGGESLAYSLQLDAAAPEGIYRIHAIFKDPATGAAVLTKSITRGFPFSAVSYNSNGGSNNLPVDTKRYTQGDEVTVLFDYLPSRTGYTFLGWSADRNAAAATYTEGGNDVFVIGDDDVTLFAVWERDNTQALLIFDDCYTQPGETVEVTVRLENMPEIKSVLLHNFVYDDTKLELVGGTWSRSDGAIADWDNVNEEGAFAFLENTDANGVFLTLTFNLLPAAVSGDILDISCAAVIKEKSGVGQEKEVDFTIVPGKIYVAIPGDFNADGYVDSDDAIYLLKHSLAPEKYPLNQNGDLNHDGFVDSDDAVYLLKFTLEPNKYPLS